MEILNLTLKNFKGHQDADFAFSRGTNAICGENGAGKTSIFEAIAWVLFDHSDYQKKELIRAGANSASAAVEFLSSLDGRCYRVKRNTQKGYELFDPQLNQKLNIKKREDVLQWLCEHLGVPKNTELSRLFAETIGIPQGTFTADFLKRPGDRKKIFDPILKVEDYKQTYDNTRDLETYAKAQVSQLRQKIELAAVQLADWDSLKAESQTLLDDIATDQAAIAQLNAAIATQQTELASMQAIAQNIESIQQQLQTLDQTHIRQVTEAQQIQQSIEQAKTSAQLCHTHQANYEKHLTAQGKLKTLQTQRQQYQDLIAQDRQVKQSLTHCQIKQSALSTQLESLTQLEAQIESLKPLIPQQTQLEQTRQQLQQQIQALKVSEGHINSLTQQIQRLQTQQQQLEAEIQASQGSHEELATLPTWESKRQEVMKAMGHSEVSQDWLTKLQPVFTQGKLDRDRHRSAVQAALKFIEDHPEDFAEIESALKEGAILNTGLLKSIHHILTELDEAASPERLNQKLQEINLKIMQLQQLQTQQSLAQAKQQQWENGDRHIQDLLTQLEKAKVAIQTLPELLEEQQNVNAQLTEIGNPKAQITTLQQQIQEKASLEHQIQQLTAQILQLHIQQQQLDQGLKQFQSLEQAVNQAQADLTESQDGYQCYLQHQTNAAQVSPLTTQLQDLEQQQSQLKSQQAELNSQKTALSANFDPEALQTLLARVQAQQIQLGQRKGGLAPKRQRSQQIQTQLTQKQAVFEQSQRDRLSLKNKQEIYDFIQEARRIYNQSGPRISELYQQEISFEADRLFREILHRQDVALQWTEDYDIQVQDGGHWRTFKSLSGGEQMCAALAVRLALLKTLADINIAFFDEPTTNMDELRRSQLAEAISNLKSFNQLFVISHDDTFEAITESIIRLAPKNESS